MQAAAGRATALPSGGQPQDRVERGARPFPVNISQPCTSSQPGGRPQDGVRIEIQAGVKSKPLLLSIPLPAGPLPSCLLPIAGQLPSCPLPSVSLPASPLPSCPQPSSCQSRCLPAHYHLAHCRSAHCQPARCLPSMICRPVAIRPTACRPTAFSSAAVQLEPLSAGPLPPGSRPPATLLPSERLAGSTALARSRPAQRAGRCPAARILRTQTHARTSERLLWSVLHVAVSPEASKDDVGNHENMLC